MRRRNKALDRLMGRLGTGSGEARREAIEAVYRHPDALARVCGSNPQRARISKRQVDQLFARLASALDDDDESVRYEAAYVLSSWCDRRAVRALLLSLTIVRERVRYDGPAQSIFPDKVGYLRIPSFTEQTPDAVRHALGDLERGGARSLVVDLRQSITASIRSS